MSADGQGHRRRLDPAEMAVRVYCVVILAGVFCLAAELLHRRCPQTPWVMYYLMGVVAAMFSVAIVWGGRIDA